VNPNQFDALVSFAFNLGVGALAHSTLLHYVNQEMFTVAADQFPRWDYAGGHESAGLQKRRLAERTLFLTPV
jgi:lysozyme